MQSQPREVPDPISLFYDAAMGEASWDDALAALTSRIGGAAFLLAVTSPRRPVLSVYWARHLATHLLYEDGFSDDDMTDPAHNPDIRASMIMPVGRAFDTRAFVSEEEALATPLFHAGIFRQDVSIRHLFVAARERDLLAGGIAAHRGGRPLNTAEARELDRALPHIGRALRLRNEIGRCESLQASLHSVLDGLSAGVALVDARLRILFANPTAEAILESRDGIWSERGRLRMSAVAHGKLTNRVAACASPDGEPVQAGSIAAPRPSGRAAYGIQVFPAIGASDLPGARSACASIVFQDPARDPALPDATSLAGALGLTLAEARVARLAPLAESKRTQAERLGLSENTVKTHLSAIRAKLGLRNMTELAQAVGRLPQNSPAKSNGSLTGVDKS